MTAQRRHQHARRAAVGALATVWMMAALAGCSASALNDHAAPTLSANGYAVRNVYLAGTIRLPVPAVQAVPAGAAWISTQGPDELNISGRHCLLYLGQASGISVFYDVHSAESLRLPSDDIVVSFQDTTTDPVGC